MVGSIGRILNDRRSFRWLLAANAAVALAMVWATRNIMLSDSLSYIGLAKGILHGNYSLWWSFAPNYPDTFRAPGYPLFIAAVIKLFGTWKPIIAIQFLLYCGSVLLTLEVIKRFNAQLMARSLFLLLLIPSVNIAFYISQVYTDIPALAMITLALWIGTRRGGLGWGGAVAMGVLFGIISEFKPVFMLMPLAYGLLAWLMDRRWPTLGKSIVMLVVHGALLLPFGFWNMRHHGVFKVTPLEGAGGYMQFSYWCGKLPGYTDTFWLHNFTGDGLVRFTPEDSIPANRKAYEREWARVNARLNPLLTAKDSAMLDAMPSMPPGTQSTFNSKYTLMRERLLFKCAVSDFLGDPWYTVKYKAYSAVRLWVIGIQRGNFGAAGVLGKSKMIYATVETGVLFLLLILLVPLAYYRRALNFRTTWPFVAWLAYCGLIQVPFTIQSRYTLCVRFAMLALIALAVASLGKRKTGTLRSK